MPRFDRYRWNAKTYKTYEAIFAAVERFGLRGKTIQAITVIGYAENMFTEELEYAARKTAAKSGVPYDILADGRYPYLDRTPVSCSVTVYEPTVIAFTDGSTFAIQPVAGGLKWASINSVSTCRTG